MNDIGLRPICGMGPYHALKSYNLNKESGKKPLPTIVKLIQPTKTTAFSLYFLDNKKTGVKREKKNKLIFIS